MPSIRGSGAEAPGSAPESMIGEIRYINPQTQRLIVKNLKTKRTKLLSLTDRSVIRRGDEKAKFSDLKVGQHVLVKYTFVEGNIEEIQIVEATAAAGEAKKGGS